jgi:hypothetical protein
MANPVPDWKVIADALAAKLLTITDGSGVVILRSATADVADNLPPAPCAIVLPPAFELDDNLSAEDYTARFEFIAPFEITGGIERTIATIYTFMNAIVPAFRTGRLLGLNPTTTGITGSRVLSVAASEITEYSPPLPGVRGEIEVRVNWAVAPRTA